MKFLKHPEPITEWQLVFFIGKSTTRFYEHWARDIGFGIFRLKEKIDRECTVQSNIQRGFYITFTIEKPFEFRSPILFIRLK